MQQVGTNPAVSATVIDPRRLPVPVRGRRHSALVSVRHKWVLHRRVLVRAGVALAVAVVLAAGFSARGGILQTTGAVTEAVSSGLATAGFGVAAIDISGQAITGERAVLAALGINDKTSLLGYDAKAARERLLALPAVTEASVRKIYPDRLAVSLSERMAVARWRDAQGTFLIDARGQRLGKALAADAQLPLVIGEGAADDAQAIIRALSTYPALGDGLAALSRIADRRWDLLYDTGLRVQLPESGVTQALQALDSYARDHQLLKRDLTLIDLRVPGSVVVRLAERDGGETNQN